MLVEKRLLIYSKILMYCAIAGAFFTLPFIINSQLTSLQNNATIQMNVLRTDTIALVNKRADSFQELTTQLFDKTDKRVGNIQDALLGPKQSFKTDVFASVDKFTETVDTLSVNVNTQLGTFNANLNEQETELNKNIDQVTTVYAALPAQVGERFNQQTDCTTNGLCWQNMTTDVLANFRYTGRDISDMTKTFNAGFPSLMKDAGSITNNVDAITGNFRRLTNPKWYDRLIGYGLNAAVIYRNLNPVTSIALTGASFLSSRP